MPGSLSIASTRPSFDVPVIVDSVKTEPIFPMTRCNYLCVECDAAKPSWQIAIGDEALPFLMLRLVGVIQQPFGALHFDTAELIEDLFRRIEDEADLLVDIEDIWLPNFLFESHDYRPRPGYVYRVNNQLFAQAWEFRQGQQDRETFLSVCREVGEGVFFSEKETEAFAEWHKSQISSAIEQYPKNKRFELPWPDQAVGGPEEDNA